MNFFPTNKFPRFGMCGRLISQVRYTVGANVRNFSGLTSDSRFANCNRFALRQLRAPWRRLRETWLHRGKMIASNSKWRANVSANEKGGNRRSSKRTSTTMVACLGLQFNGFYTRLSSGKTTYLCMRYKWQKFVELVLQQTFLSVSLIRIFLHYWN